MIVPTNRLMWCILAWALASVLAAFFPVALTPWLILGVVILCLALMEIIFLLGLREPIVDRTLPGRFALGEKGEVKLKIVNRSRFDLYWEMFDGIPQGAEALSLPWEGLIPRGKHAIVRYDVVIKERGICEFGNLFLRVSGLLRLWKRSVVMPMRTEGKVYPNYAPVLRLSLMATKSRQEQMGIVRKSRAGSSKDFHQLRDYRQGDSLSQIDWKSTSRRLQLISRDYQEQRNQQIVFLLDSGRRMRSIDGDLPHFDHCLNALLLVAYVALRQGDHVAVQSFGGTDRWLAPVRGNHAMATILNHLYDAETTTSPSDFSEAVEKVMMRNRRRALVIVMTNLRGEDSHEIIPALRTLQSRHLVLLASLHEGVVRDALEKPVEDFAMALKHVAARQYMDERREVLATLEAHGIMTMDVTADQLAIGLANRYLDIKAAGKL